MALAASRRAYYAFAREQGLVSGGVKLAETADEIARCYAVMANLRPHVPESEFVGRVQTQQMQGYG